MSTDAALDDLAFSVGLRLMGPDARRRLRLSLARNPEVVGYPGFNVEAAERLDELLDGRRPPASLQDRLDLARAERDRRAAPFDPGFWARCTADLIHGGFDPEQARGLVDEVRGRVDAPPQTQSLQEQQHVE